jgi:tetratricopeptide (TPR) repeat protein
VLHVLEGLVAQSLLRTATLPEFPDEVRIGHFVSVQEFAAARLPEAPAAWARHARFFLEAGERWDAGIETAAEAENTRRLIVELPNLEAALERASDDREAARFGLLLHFAYQRRGPFGRQAELVERIVESARRLADERLLARAVLARARVRRWANDLDASLRDLEEAGGRARAAGDVETEASCLRNLAAARFRQGDAEAARAPIEQALDAARRSGRPPDEVNALNGLGYYWTMRGDFDRAQLELEQALRLARRTETPGLIALVLSSLGDLMFRRGRLDEAERASSEAIARYEELSYLRQLVTELLLRGRIRCLSGAAGAGDDAARALELARRMGLRMEALRALALSALIAFHARDFARCHEVVEEALERLGDTHAASVEAEIHAYDAAARALRGDLAAAEVALERAVKAGGPTGRVALARAFVALGRARSARTSEAPGDPLLERPSDPDPGDRLAETMAAAEAAAASGDAELVRGGALLAEIAAAVPRSSRPPAARLELPDDARWFRLAPNEAVDITRRPALRGILRSLCDQRLARPGIPLRVDDVLEAGWPGERMSPDSGARRVYVTINRLRKLGLGELLLTMGDGYMLAPEVEIVRAGA